MFILGWNVAMERRDKNPPTPPLNEGGQYGVTKKIYPEKPRTREELQILLTLEKKKTQALSEALESATRMDVN